MSTSFFGFRYFRFSLRTLFVLVTAVGIVLGFCGYELEWIRQRRELISKESSRSVGCEQGPYEESHKMAPGLLWMFGEGGVDYIKVIVTESAVRRSDGEYIIQRTNPTYQRAMRLFPEGRIIPVVIVGGNIGVTWTEIVD